MYKVNNSNLSMYKNISNYENEIKKNENEIKKK